MATLGEAYVQIVPSAKGIAGSLLGAIAPDAEKAGATSGTLFGSKFGAAAKLLAGSAAVAAFGKFIQMSVKAGGALEQSIGGVETLFKKSAGTVIKDADNAYKTAGLSANAYMQQVTSFSASLLQSLGGDTQKAAKQAKMAITDMADNSNKMGTSMQSIQDAYQGFAKQNYTMLDNLKLGYGGTKTEMERLLSDAEKISGVHYDINNLNDVYSAIHVIQGELGITGTTAKEAATTLEGSFNSMKAAAENVLADLALNRNVNKAMTALAQTASTFVFGNLIPMIGNIVAALPKAIAAFLQTGVPLLFSGVKTMMSKLGSYIIANGPAMVTGIQSAFKGLTAAIMNIDPATGTKIMSDLGRFLIAALPILINALTAIMEGVSSLLGTLVIKLAQMGWEWIKALAKGVANGVGDLVLAGGQAAANFNARIVQAVGDLINSGLAWVRGIATGIGRGLGSVVAAAARIISGAVSAVRSGVGSMMSAGLDLVRGIWRGISNGYGWITGKIRGWVGNVVNYMKRAFKIGSPSRVMADEIGRWIPAGIAMGIQGNASAVTRAMDDISASVIKPLNAGTALADISSVVAGRADQEGAGESITQIININQPVSSPVETARAIKNQAIRLGLAGV